MRTLDSGTMGGDTGSWSFLLAMLAVTFGLIFVISTFNDTLPTALEAQHHTRRQGLGSPVTHRHSQFDGLTARLLGEQPVYRNPQMLAFMRRVANMFLLMLVVQVAVPAAVLLRTGASLRQIAGLGAAAVAIVLLGKR